MYERECCEDGGNGIGLGRACLGSSNFACSNVIHDQSTSAMNVWSDGVKLTMVMVW